MDDYWEPGKALLQDPGKFLEGLFKYDKVKCPFPRLSDFTDLIFRGFNNLFLVSGWFCEIGD